MDSCHRHCRGRVRRLIPPDQSGPEPEWSGDLWAKVNHELVVRADAGDKPAGKTFEGTGKKLKEHSKHWHKQRAVLDVIGSLLWLYLLLLTFVFDVDRDVVEPLSGGHAIADHKFVIFIVGLALLVLIRRRNAGLAILYLLVFPAVVVFWKIPRRLYRTNSWVTFLAAANVVSTGVLNLRTTIIAFAGSVVAAFLVLGGGPNVLIGIGMVMTAILLLFGLYRAVIYALKPSAFLDIQERAITQVVDSEVLAAFVDVNEPLTNSEIEKFDEAQQAQFVNNLSCGLLAHRILYLWAYQLDRYRKSSAPILFNVLITLALLLSAVIGLTLIDYGLYAINPGAFTFASAPSIFTFGRYAFSSLYGNEISAVQAHSDLANAISLASMFFGIGILGTFVVTLFNARRDKQNAAAEQAIAKIKGAGNKLETRLEENYEVSAQVALERIKELQGLFVSWIAYLSDRIPDDFDDSVLGDDN